MPTACQSLQPSSVSPMHAIIWVSAWKMALRCPPTPGCGGKQTAPSSTALPVPFRSAVSSGEASLSVGVSLWGTCIQESNRQSVVAMPHAHITELLTDAHNEVCRQCPGKTYQPRPAPSHPSPLLSPRATSSDASHHLPPAHRKRPLYL